MYKIADSKKELNDCFELRKEVFVDEQNVPQENEFDEFEDESTHIIVYDNDKRPLATARYRSYQGKAKIERVVVVKDQRMHGIGRRLMQFIEEAAQKDGFKEAVLNGQIQAQSFYESLGYHPQGEIFIEEEIKHIKMQKQL
ncbi:GNAT family N-acetyltransferase [Staphylococcus condimenti]|uniref:GCN5-related N-acetyltransferase n=1 Tax=Staphylococcus condimenti TaxID=70255 RepID=A0A143P9Q6_9STAP|nr:MULTISPECIES: GNAT family N-acetyltransferase [Staphylococcus]AMY05261.1 GNAT family N-acetyltransferase [Staphylococcus condimenti]APR61467.1 GNAT family N-acetyltransferase [Staphylococcus condimenti]MDK8645268.1 GNAT family N-acetyltransferase [Staphylococcus condimenti]OFO98723.1 GNAT family N-acetyltransferase [Staphylococcus sp. HMSC065E08]PNZ59750.1 GNAT family N-acetyltransferase [Staphylococcus condimenti]